MSEEDEARKAYEDARVFSLRLHAGWPFVNYKPQRLGVAVSGGSDSMALLDLMHWQAREKGFEIRAVTVDHGLRREAKDEIAAVAEVCKTEGIRHVVLAWEGWDGTGNLQAKARKARYGLISHWAERSGVDCIALGHTEDDQAETVLMRLARSSGVDGLAGMPDRFERGDLVFIRPLLSNRREELRNYLRYRDIKWCEDPSNDDDSFERVRARKASAVLADLGIDADALSRVSWHARSAKWALDHYLWLEVSKNELVREDRGDLILPEQTPSPKHDAPAEIHRRALNKAVQWVSGAEYPPRSMSLIQMSAAMSQADRHTLGGCFVSRIESGKRRFENELRITREFNAVRDLATPTDELWDGRWSLEGPHTPDLEIRALGEAVKDCPDWRDTGLPRTSLLASPAVWRGGVLVAAPLAGFSNGWTASATGRGSFAKFLLSR